MKSYREMKVNGTQVIIYSRGLVRIACASQAKADCIMQYLKDEGFIDKNLDASTKSS